MAVTTKLYSFHITAELAAALKRLKERDGISESEAIRRALARFLEEKEVLLERHATASPTRRRRKKETR